MSRAIRRKRRRLGAVRASILEAPSVADLAVEGTLLPDERVAALVARLSPTHKIFLAAIGRGLPAVEAAERAGWHGGEARKIAAIYLSAHPVVTPLAGHILRLRELASLDGEDPTPSGPTSVH